MSWDTAQGHGTSSKATEHRVGMSTPQVGGSLSLQVVWNVAHPSDRNLCLTIHYASHCSSSQRVVEMSVWVLVGIHARLKYYRDMAYLAMTMGCMGPSRFLQLVESLKSALALNCNSVCCLLSVSAYSGWL